MKFGTLVKAVIATALVGFSSLAMSGVDTDTAENGVILAGHDAVAYFTESKAVEGSSKFTAEHNDAVYQFSSAKNRDLFKANPDKYEPAYGGFCAYGATLGKKFSIDGKAFQVVDGKLYVNKNLDVYEIWEKDIPAHIQQADAKWPAIESVPADQL